MKEIFVFGSNLAGRHGAGSALHAMQFYGAKYGIGVGRTGDAYAIPTKDSNIQSMRLEDIKPYVRQFLDYAKEHPELTFHVVAIGCGLAGFTPEQIAPMFWGATAPPQNVQLPTSFLTALLAERKI